MHRHLRHINLRVDQTNSGDRNCWIVKILNLRKRFKKHMHIQAGFHWPGTGVETTLPSISRPDKWGNGAKSSFLAVTMIANMLWHGHGLISWLYLPMIWAATRPLSLRNLGS